MCDHSVICLWRSEGNAQELVLFFPHGFQGPDCSESIFITEPSCQSHVFLYSEFIQSTLCFLHFSMIFFIRPAILLDPYRSGGYSVLSATSKSIYRFVHTLGQPFFFPHGYPNSSQFPVVLRSLMTNTSIHRCP